MATLKIYKVETNLFRHEPSDKNNWFVSSFYCKTDGDYFQVVESGGSKRGEYLFSDVEVYDVGGSAETFASSQQLMQRLKELGYTGFFREGEVPPIPLSDLEDVNISGVTNGQVIKYNSSTQNWENANESGGGATTFLGLTDTPSSYTGEAGKVVTVNGTENGLEFTTPTSGSKKSFIIQIPISQNVAASTSWYTRGTNTQNIFTATFSANASLTPVNDFADHGVQNPCNVVPFDCRIKSVVMRGHTNSAPTDIRVVVLKSDRMTSNQATVVNPDIIADKTFNTQSPVANVYSAIFSGSDLDTTVTIPQGGEIRLLFFNNNVASNLYTTVCAIELEEI